MGITIVNVGYRSTNYWIISNGARRLMVDLGWPGHLGALLAALERKTIPLREIGFGFATHYHIDHAGLAQDLKQRGMQLIVTPEQVPAIPLMKRHVKAADRYTEISLHDNVVVPCDDSRRFLATIGVSGQLVPTPGHSDDSVTLLLDGGEAFIGDLTPPQVANEQTASIVASSWDRLRALGARMVYPGHGPVRPLS